MIIQRSGGYGGGSGSVGRRKASMKRKANISGRVKGRMSANHSNNSQDSKADESGFGRIELYGGWGAQVGKSLVQRNNLYNKRIKSPGLIINKIQPTKQPTQAASQAAIERAMAQLTPRQLQDLTDEILRKAR